MSYAQELATFKTNQVKMLNAKTDEIELLKQELD